MPIVVDIDVMLARRKMSVGTLADLVGVTPANLAVLKNGRARAVRFSFAGSSPSRICFLASSRFCRASAIVTRG